MQSQLLKDQEVLGSRSQYTSAQKFQILIFSLLFNSFLDTFSSLNTGNSEVTSIWFIFTELQLCDISLINQKPQLKEKVFGFLEKASSQEGVKSLSFFTCINDTQIQSDLIGDFLLRNAQLQKELFGIDYDSKKKLSYFKQTLIRESYEKILKKVQSGKWELKRGETQVQDLRIFEELGLDQQLIEFTYKFDLQNAKQILEHLQK